jgi:hypothetical protein
VLAISGYKSIDGGKIMSNNYLNLNGLSIFLDKLKTIFTTKDYLNSLNLKGDKGDPGTSVSKVEQISTSVEDGGVNTFRITLSNGTTADFSVKNGSKGSTGATGATGAQGPKGNTGASGSQGPAGTAAGFGTPTLSMLILVRRPLQLLHLEATLQRCFHLHLRI